MADYVAREWSGGDIVTAANLNNIEQGIADASSGGGGTEPLIIHTTEEKVTAPNNSVLGYKTDTLISDAYEAWQNGRPIYRSIDGDEWAVSHVNEKVVTTIYWQSDVGVTQERLVVTPLSGGYLVELGARET